MWPMIAAYGMRLVKENHHGKAIAVIMAGNTLGISVGIPVMTFIGNEYGWRTEFIGLGVVILGIALISFFALPSTPGEKLTKGSSPFALLKIPEVLIVLLLTLLAVIAQYGMYVYITGLVEEIQLSGGIESALLLFGIGSLISVLLAIKYTDQPFKTAYSGYVPFADYFDVLVFDVRKYYRNRSYRFLFMGTFVWAACHFITGCRKQTGRKRKRCRDFRSILGF